MSYPSNGNHPKLGEKGLLGPDSCVVALINHQLQMLSCSPSFLPKADTSEPRNRAPAEQAGALVRTRSGSIQHAQAFPRTSLF